MFITRITSYNVCYTKLLRTDIVKPVINPQATPIPTATRDEDLMGDVINIEWPSEIKLQPRIPMPELPVAQRIVITSYSIHYTKLYDS